MSTLASQLSVTTRLQQLDRISALPKAQQRFVMQMLDTVLQQQGG